MKEAVTFSVLFFIVSWWAFWRFDCDKSNRTWICTACFAAQNFNREQRCKCGGALELLDLWEWVEETCDTQSDESGDCTG